MIATELPYVRGEVLRSTADDLVKLRKAWREIARRRAAGEPVWNFTGLERGLRVAPADLELMDDEVASALFGERVRELALEHLGGDAERHDVLVTNRLTAALVASHLVLVSADEKVVGISAGYSHPAVRRAARLAGADFADTSTLEELERELDEVALVVVTRLAVTYDLLDADVVAGAVVLAQRAGARVLVDDAGGARVAPAVLGQPRTLELGADVGATGLDKYGTVGPRLGLLAGDRDLVAEIRARAYELGLEARPLLLPAVVASLEQYRPGRVRELVACTREVTVALRARLGELVHETPVTAQLRGEAILSRLGDAPIVPYEATAALAMRLLLDHGILTVHFAAVPPGTSALLFKFVPPELLADFGGAERFAEAVDSSLERLAAEAGDAASARRLLLG